MIHAGRVMAAASMIAGLAPGDHACWAFDDDDRYLRTAVDYVRAGLRNHQRVVFYLPTGFFLVVVCFVLANLTASTMAACSWALRS